MNQGHPSLPQIPFEFGNYQQNDFTSFFVGENKTLLNVLSKLSNKENKHRLYLWGASGTGKSHLLQAVCKQANEHEQHVAYIPLKQHKEMSPDMLHDLGMLDLVCIDDLESIQGETEWQQGLTWLYNELRDNDHSLIISAATSPANIELEVEDLKSRLGWDQVYQISSPSDDLKIEILKQKAEARSFKLNDEVIEYIIRRVDRDLGSLLKILDDIDQASLAAKRKVTIPFVKELLS